MCIVVNKARLSLTKSSAIRGGWIRLIPLSQSALGQQLGRTRAWPGHCIFVTMHAMILLAAGLIVHPREVTLCGLQSPSQSMLPSLALQITPNAHFAPSGLICDGNRTVLSACPVLLLGLGSSVVLRSVVACLLASVIRPALYCQVKVSQLLSISRVAVDSGFGQQSSFYAQRQTYK